MMCFISKHACVNHRKRCRDIDPVEVLDDVFNARECIVEMIEKAKPKYPENHLLYHSGKKIVMVFNWTMDTLITVNPCPVGKLKKRRSQSWKGFLAK